MGYKRKDDELVFEADRLPDDPAFSRSLVQSPTRETKPEADARERRARMRDKLRALGVGDGRSGK